MPKFLHLLASVLVWALLSVQAATAQSRSAEGELLAAGMAAVEQEDWETLSALRARVSDPVMGDLLDWARLRKGEGSFDEYRGFLARNPDWPGLNLLRIKGEAAIPEGADAKAVIAYFDHNPPQTGEGVLRLAEALTATGKREAARKQVIRAWRNFSMSKEVRVELMARYGKVLKPHHAARLDMLLWRGLGEQAEALYDLLPAGTVALAKARIGLRRKAKGVDGLINAVPRNLARDPGLAYERFLWRAAKGRYEAARDLMIARSVSAKSLGKPEKWAKRRRAYAREEMRKENNRRAYKLAANHFLTEGPDYADLEWLAGYIALRKLKNPKQALVHFNRFRAAVGTPISYGRAGYWQGRALDALGERKRAREAYAFAAQYQTSFYGQLAAQKIGAAPDPALAGNQTVPDWRGASFARSPVLRAGLLLLRYTDERDMAENFFRKLAEGQGAEGIQQLAELALEIGRPNFAVRLSKMAARKGHVLPKTYFPLTELAQRSGRVKPEVAMSIARRESELDQFIISPAGARGLMQLMPGTAKKMAKEIGISYSRDRLTSDWRYNARLGTAYLASMLDEFGGSFILAFAAYNAGPNRAKRWIEELGDPRSDRVDQIDWIEHIPFRETRNYVMRAMESLHVYRARIKGRTPKLRLVRDLRKG